MRISSRVQNQVTVEVDGGLAVGNFEDEVKCSSLRHVGQDFRNTQQVGTGDVGPFKTADQKF
jgi:hypothetical protein